MEKKASDQAIMVLSPAVVACCVVHVCCFDCTGFCRKKIPEFVWRYVCDGWVRDHMAKYIFLGVCYSISTQSSTHQF